METIERWAYRCSRLKEYVEAICGNCGCSWAIRGTERDLKDCPDCGTPFWDALTRQQNTDARWER
jgi:protein-arginine kinase activator protein McsA